VLTQQDLEQNLRSRTGPVLSDGTTLRELIDFDRHAVALRVLTDPEIYRLELERLFARSWVFLAHESEIPKSGDFVLRYIGEDSVIVTRGDDGAVNVLLNVCAHRGMELCWADEGNQRTFKCPYHGWVYDTAGRLLGAPFERDMYGDWDKAGFGLCRARVATRHGLIFGNFSDQAPSFEDYLGEFMVYFDRAYAGDWEVLGPPAGRHLIHSNWKPALDNNIGDSYHGLTLHHCMIELGMMKTEQIQLDHVKVSFAPYGHGVFAFSPLGSVQDGKIEEGGEALGGENASFDNPSILFAHAISPGSWGFGASAMPLPGGSELRSAIIGGITPHGVGSCEFWSLTLVDKASSPESREVRRKVGGPFASAIAVDDTVTWSAITRSARGIVGQRQTMKYFALRGEHKPPDWPDVGRVHAGNLAGAKDDNQWNMWTCWFNAMTTDEA